MEERGSPRGCAAPVGRGRGGEGGGTYRGMAERRGRAAARGTKALPTAGPAGSGGRARALLCPECGAGPAPPRRHLLLPVLRPPPGGAAPAPPPFRAGTVGVSAGLGAGEGLGPQLPPGGASRLCPPAARLHKSSCLIPAPRDAPLSPGSTKSRGPICSALCQRCSPSPAPPPPHHHPRLHLSCGLRVCFAPSLCGVRRAGTRGTEPWAARVAEPLPRRAAAAEDPRDPQRRAPGTSARGAPRRQMARGAAEGQVRGKSLIRYGTLSSHS